MSDEIFNKSLSRFIKDFASRDEILAKHRIGLDAESIRKELLFKIPIEDIERIISESEDKSDFIRVFDKYGNASFIKKYR